MGYAHYWKFSNLSNIDRNVKENTFLKLKEAVEFAILLDYDIADSHETRMMNDNHQM